MARCSLVRARSDAATPPLSQVPASTVSAVSGPPTPLRLAARSPVHADEKSRAVGSWAVRCCERKVRKRQLPSSKAYRPKTSVAREEK